MMESVGETKKKEVKVRKEIAVKTGSKDKRNRCKKRR